MLLPRRPRACRAHAATHLPARLSACLPAQLLRAPLLSLTARGAARRGAARRRWWAAWCGPSPRPTWTSTWTSSSRRTPPSETKCACMGRGSASVPGRARACTADGRACAVRSKVSEQIVRALLKMKCPHRLEAQQIQAHTCPRGARAAPTVCLCAGSRLRPHLPRAAVARAQGHRGLSGPRARGPHRANDATALHRRAS
jgi:hypothetical protein